MAHCTNPDKNRPFEMAGRAGAYPGRELDFPLDLCLQALASRRRITVQAAVPTQAWRLEPMHQGPAKQAVHANNIRLPPILLGATNTAA